MDSVMFADANLFNNRKALRNLLFGLIDWNRKRGYPMRFCGEITLNIADHPDLLQLMVEAGFQVVFVGFETLTDAGLKAIGKPHNITFGGMLKSVRMIQSYGIDIFGGFVIGFDHDKPGVGQEVCDFLEDAGIVLSTAGPLIPQLGTPIWFQLAQAGRLCDPALLAESKLPVGTNFGGVPCFQPSGMTLEELIDEGVKMTTRLVSVDSMIRRLRSAWEHVGLGNWNLSRRVMFRLDSLRTAWKIYNACLYHPELRPLALEARQLVFKKPKSAGNVARWLCLLWQQYHSFHETKPASL
jgi:radical SAM superfamily enzyme YgiQ (UPF0313 family)